MNTAELQTLWSETLRASTPTAEQFGRLANAVVDVYSSGDTRFRQHIKNRYQRVTEATGQTFDEQNFDLAMARAFIADEIGFASWNELTRSLEYPAENGYPILFRYAIAAMWRGDFTALEHAVGGCGAFDEQIIDWYEKGYFDDEPETLAEVFSAACMLGHAKTAGFLLDHGVDPYAGMKTGLSGFHYAASSGRLGVIKLLIERGVPMEVRNMYNGTVLGQALWSAINEYTPEHAEIIERLIEAGATVEDGTLEWWEKQKVPNAETRARVASALRRHAEFHEKVDAAQKRVSEAESRGGKRVLADSLKTLGNILRRPPFTRDAANEVYARAADLYSELGLPLEAAWVKRHIGINYEYAKRLNEAEKYYDEALDLYREHSKEDDLNYANAVRYPAVIKNRLGKREEATALWEEAHDRYSAIGPNGLGEGVAEAAAWLTIFAIEKRDRDLAEKWFARASKAAAASSDPDTHKFIAEVRERLKE